jgi:PEP-CTERM motif
VNHLLPWVRRLVVLCGVFFVGAAQATVLVHVVQNDPTSTDASMVPSATLPSVDFLSPAINFNTGFSDGTTLAAFLNNPTFTNQQNGFDPSQSADNIFLEIVAQTFLNAGANSFVVGHDDGVVLTFSDSSIGTVVNAPGPTGFVNTPFNVNALAAGLYGFDLRYTECCSGPADLVFTINGAPVGSPGLPEPASAVLVGIGLVGLVTFRRRRRSV